MTLALLAGGLFLPLAQGVSHQPHSEHPPVAIPVQNGNGAATLVFSEGVLSLRQGGRELRHLALPLSVCVGGQQIGSSTTALIAGNDEASNARLCLVDFSSTGMHLLAVPEYPRIRCDALAYSPEWSCLFLADGLHGRLLAAPWVGCRTLPSREAWVLVADRNAIGILVPQGRPGGILMTCKPDEMTIQPAGLAMMRWVIGRDLVGGWTTRMERTSNWPGARDWVQVGDDVSTLGPVTVTSSLSGNAVVENLETHARIAIGRVVAGIQSTLTLPAGRLLEPGSQFAIHVTEASGEAVSGGFYSFLRTGAATGESPVQFQAPIMSVPWCTEGSAKFGTACKYVFARDVSASDPMDVFVLFASQTPGAPDPWQMVRSVSILQPNRILLLPRVQGMTGHQGTVGASLVLQRDQFSAGDRLYVQFVCLGHASESACVSAICGLPIAPASATNAGSPELREKVLSVWRAHGATSPAQVEDLYNSILSRLP